MKEYKVIKIISEPEEMTLRLDHLHLKYWGVSVTLQCKDDIHDSTVTFEDKIEALKLKVGDVFCR